MTPSKPQPFDLAAIAYYSAKAGASRHFVRAVLAGDPWALALFRLAGELEQGTGRRGPDDTHPG